MKFIVFIFLSIGLIHCDVYVNKLFDTELANMGNIFRKFHLKYITIGDITVSDDIKASNVKLGDISRIVRKGDATMDIENNIITSQGAVGIDKLLLVMDTLELNGKTYRKALAVVGSNMLTFKSDIYSTRTACNQTYSGIRLSRVQGVMLYSKPSLKINVTSQFIKEVVPFVNRKLSSPSVLHMIQKYLNSCQPNLQAIYDWFQDTEDQSSSDSSVTSNSMIEDVSEIIQDLKVYKSRSDEDLEIDIILV